MSTKIGNRGEQVAAKYLQQQGYKILERNWRIPAAEIDIVACRKNSVVFVEVKYRSTNLQGSGLDYITPAKLTQMKRAAAFWVSENKWRKDYLLAAIAVDGSGQVTEFLESINAE